MNFALMTRNCVLETRDFAFKMMNSAGQQSVRAQRKPAAGELPTI